MVMKPQKKNKGGNSQKSGGKKSFKNNQEK